ncbi:MAG: aminodeoxychorismate/anthranilate synthase component II [Deltaproteobacteria bacterium]|nr:aminodeoxychorismate/anthranilate synthase component II [Deltaproteobacteria bacterium]MCB9785891.1 aminodeoxychorismate/anthranilate synthase component II [Deltaproteobacteria bacterium]
MSATDLKLLMIDNYDSFTWNLVQYFGELGVVPQVVRNDAWTVAECEAFGADGIVISPGPCTPAEAGVSVPLIQRLSGRTPLFGVCLGHQSIGAAFGGRIVRAGVIMHGKTSPISHAGTDLFRGLPDPLAATRYHSLVIERTSLPDCLRETAWTEDPAGRTIMGVAHREHPTWGVQFHPESILTESGRALLANFLDLTRAHMAGAGGR